MPQMLLDRFQGLFEGQKYIHRDSSLGDFIAQALPEDLFELGLSLQLCKRILVGSRVINIQNQRRGIVARRGMVASASLSQGLSWLAKQALMRALPRPWLSLVVRLPRLKLAPKSRFLRKR